MKLHIECLQEKLDQVQKENEKYKQSEDKNKTELDRVKKTMSRIEGELKIKNEKLKDIEALKEAVENEMKLEKVR